MIQKSILMRYFIIGITILVLSLTNSCNGESDCLVISDFIFINNTNHIIETPIGIINSNSNLSIHDEYLGPCDVNSNNFVPPFLGKTEIIFDNIKCLIYQSESVAVGDGPVGLSNYTITKISNNHYEFQYEFTETEYDQAEDCN